MTMGAILCVILVFQSAVIASYHGITGTLLHKCLECIRWREELSEQRVKQNEKLRELIVNLADIWDGKQSEVYEE